MTKKINAKEFLGLSAIKPFFEQTEIVKKRYFFLENVNAQQNKGKIDLSMFRFSLIIEISSE